MFRPSGDLSWTLSCSTPREWQFFGSINSERRSIEAAQALSSLGVINSSRILRIKWPDSPFCVEGESMTSDNFTRFGEFCEEPQTLDRGLLSSVADIAEDTQDLTSSSVILDITSMPKRFFFFYLKTLLSDPRVEDLLVTYCAGKYQKGPLSGNPENWDVLPTFRGGDKEKEAAARSRLVVNVGFMPDGLQEHLKNDDTEQDLFLILPVPAKVSSTRRVWKSAMEIKADWSGDTSAVHISRMAPDDISGAFDLIQRISNGNRIALAPFGPKPISAAMCLYAVLNDSPVYYAQPKWYNPTYTVSPDTNESGIPRISGHWIKHRGQSLYSL